MKYTLSLKIKEEAYKCAKLRELSMRTDYDTTLELRKHQEKCWSKFYFFKNLAQALRKLED